MDVTEWVGVCGTGRCVIIQRVPVLAVKIWVKGVYMGQEFAVNNIVCFYGTKSRFTIYDDPGVGLRSTIRDPKIVTSLLSGIIYGG